MSYSKNFECKWNNVYILNVYINKKCLIKMHFKSSLYTLQISTPDLKCNLNEYFRGKRVKVKLFVFLKKFIMSFVSLLWKRNLNETRILKPPNNSKSC
jgi:hypothetical protein